VPDELSNQIRAFRKERGWTQAQLAEVMGVSRKTVNTIENGIFSPSVVVALKFSKALDLPVERLFQLKP
jgi:putative transcriptional regulator